MKLDKRVLIYPLIAGTIFISGCVTNPASPYYGQGYSSGLRALGELGATLGNKKTPAQEREAIRGLGAIGTLMDLLSK